MRIVRQLKRHVQFSKRERLSFVVLMTIMFACMGFTIWAHYFQPPERATAELVWQYHDQPIESADSLSANSPESFTFDPNTVSFNELLALGLSSKTAGTFIKYRNSGARFTSAQDLSKIYGISAYDLQRLQPLVRIQQDSQTFRAHDFEDAQMETLPEITITDYFDPNAIGYQDWIKLGIPGKVAATAVSYIKKGGRFKTADDLLKVYGFQQEDLERIKPFIRIETTVEQGPEVEKKTAVIVHAVGQLNINTITLQELINCGIRQQAAWSVLNYRDKLGGYYSAQQFHEIKDLSELDLQVLLQCVQVSGNGTRKLRINSASFTELANHPYLSDKLARAIIHYRDSTGNFISVNEISRAYRISPQYLEKLKYYLSL